MGGTRAGDNADASPFAGALSAGDSGKAVDDGLSGANDNEAKISITKNGVAEEEADGSTTAVAPGPDDAAPEPPVGETEEPGASLV